jgi:hypothetical protein
MNRNSDLSARPVIHNMHDLEKYGLNYLTGEACAYGMRVLFDLNDDGKALLTKFWSCAYIDIYPRMNNKVNGQPATGSVMLTHQMLAPLCEFIMFDIEQVDFIAIGNGDYHGYMNTDQNRYGEDDVATVMENAGYKIHRNWKRMNSSQPSVGDRNVHAMTGRSV